MTKLNKPGRRLGFQVEMKIMHIIGARPQFIKYCPMSRAIESMKKHREDAKNVLVHTGQHYDYSMSKVFFDELGIEDPDYHLGVGSASHGEQTGEVIKRVEEVLKKEQPSVVLVYGDTNSTLGASVATAKLHIPLGHIEAGLRSFNKLMPEEINRILTDHVSTFLFCPSRTAAQNLKNEGFQRIWNDGELMAFGDVSANLKEGTKEANENKPLAVNVGDVMFDGLLHSAQIAEKRSRITEKLNLEPMSYILLTLHRAENTDNVTRFGDLVTFVNDASDGKTVIFPMHPRTRQVYEKSAKRFGSSVRLVEPVGYFDVLMLLKNCEMVMTDSGGMQKEAYWLRRPCITLREETEWTETIESGWNILYGHYKGHHGVQGENPLAYGDGKAAEKICWLIGQSVS
jgi:UDP-N-acetylglucosamine 2-epimerase